MQTLQFLSAISEDSHKSVGGWVLQPEEPLPERFCKPSLAKEGGPLAVGDFVFSVSVSNLPQEEEDSS